MCKYCDKKVNNKQILDIDDDKENLIELRQVMMEELTYTLYVELDGEDIDGYKPFDYFRINYCPMCRKKAVIQQLGGITWTYLIKRR